MTDTEHATGPTRTHLAKPWVIRMVLIAAVLWAFGGWTFYDAAVKYPAQGRLHAEKLQFEYLKAARSAGRLFEASVFDPAGDLESLKERDVLELSEFDRAKRDWLESLAIRGLGMLHADHTQMDDPTAELQRLEEHFQTKPGASALSAYDIILQWAICALCWTLGTYMLLLFVLVKSRSYRWEPATHTLTLPGGTTIAPADLDKEDPADLVKWHKFIVFLRPRAAHEKLSGAIRLDLFRYDPLEDWIRLLVKAVDAEFEFPDEIKAREEAEAAAKAESEPQPDEES